MEPRMCYVSSQPMPNPHDLWCGRDSWITCSQSWTWLGHLFCCLYVGPSDAVVGTRDACTLLTATQLRLGPEVCAQIFGVGARLSA